MDKEDIYISAWDLKRQHKVCNFGLKVEICWSLKRRERPTSCSSEEERPTGNSSEGREPLVTQADLSASRVWSPAVALLHKTVPATEERYVRNHPGCISIAHNRRRRREKYKLYFYISMSPLLFVQRFDMRHIYIYIY